MRARAVATALAIAGLVMAARDARDAAQFAGMLRQRHPHGNVLVIGHSNTLPALARALCHCAVEEMDEANYGLRYRVQFDATGRSQLQVEQE